MEDAKLLIENLRNTVSEKSKTMLEEKLSQYSNPLGFDGISFKETSKDTTITRGGGGEVRGVDRATALGGSRAGTTITVSVGGNASVRIEMWFSLATVAAGQWVVGGPGSSSFQLNCNVLQNGCSQWFGQPVSIVAVGVAGRFPVWVSFNP